MLVRILAFIIVFGLIVIVHEFGHFYFARRSGILVREFSIGMGPKLFAHIGRDGVSYTIRLLPLGGYVRMAGWGEDTTEFRAGSPVTLTLGSSGQVTRINLTDHQDDLTALPMRVTSYDLEDKLTLTGLVGEDSQTFSVDHDATIVEEDGTEVRIAPKDVQFQNASLSGRLITNFAGPLNNFILGVVLCLAVIFLQGGSQDASTNAVQVQAGGAAAQAGLVSGDRILAVNQTRTSNWSEIAQAVSKATSDHKTATSLRVTYAHQGKKQETAINPKKVNGNYLLGISIGLKTGFWDKVTGSFTMAWDSAFSILNALKNLILHPSLNKLGGPVAMYQMIGQAADSGLVALLSFTAMLSLNLGIFNLLPIPALDGGKILLNLIEAVRRKPLRQETETIVTLVGVVIMVILMVAVTWNDIVRAFMN